MSEEADKKTDKVVVAAQVSTETDERLRERAKLLGWSKSQLIARIIQMEIGPKEDD